MVRGESEVLSVEGVGSETVRRRGSGGSAELGHKRLAGDGGEKLRDSVGSETERERGEKLRASVGSETERERGEKGVGWAEEGPKGIGRSILEKEVRLCCWGSRRCFLVVAAGSWICVGERRFLCVAAQRGGRRPHEEQSGGRRWWVPPGLRQRVEKRESKCCCSGFWGSADSWIKLLIAPKYSKIDWLSLNGNSYDHNLPLNSYPLRLYSMNFRLFFISF